MARARARFSCVWTRPNPCAEALVALGHACAQLKNAWVAIEKMPADARRAAIAAYELPQKGGAKSSIKIFSDEEEEILVSFCNIALEGTFGVSKEFVHELMCDILRTPGRAHSSRNMTVSMSTVKTWMRANGVKKFKSNSIDPARVAKATEHVRDAWFARVDRCAALAAAASVQPPRPCSRRVRAAAASVQPPCPCTPRPPCPIDGACACLGTSGSCIVRARSQHRGRAGTTCRRAPSSMCASRLERRRLDDR